MPDVDELIDQVRVPHGRSIRLKDYDPSWAGDPARPKAERKQLAEELLTQDVTALAEAQDRLYAADCWSILVVLQAMDAAGLGSSRSIITRCFTMLAAMRSIVSWNSRYWAVNRSNSSNGS